MMLYPIHATRACKEHRYGGTETDQASRSASGDPNNNSDAHHQHMTDWGVGGADGGASYSSSIHTGTTTAAHKVGHTEAGCSPPLQLPLLVNFCPLNPCITNIVNSIHQQILDGVQGAEAELNRYLTVCSFLEEASDCSGGLEGQEHFQQDSSSDTLSPATAHIVLDCLCGNPAHEIRLRKHHYRQQFRIGCKSTFVQRTDSFQAQSRAAAAAAGGGGGGNSDSSRHTSSFVPLHIPLASIIPCREGALHHSLLPDLGNCFRTVLRKRFFSESAKKHWVKSATNFQILGSGGSSTPLPASNACGDSSGSRRPSASNHHGHNHSAQSISCAQYTMNVSPSKAASAAASQMWDHSGTMCVSLIHESIPCLKKFKRNPVSFLPATLLSSLEGTAFSKDSNGRVKGNQTGLSSSPSAETTSRKARTGPRSLSSQGRDAAAQSLNPVDLCACINVLYGTLLKLYDLGVKTPTFNARVAMTRRLSRLSCMPAEDQARFLMEYPSLTRLCFMEYSLNALMDWLPCEMELLCKVCAPMKTYCSIAVSMCDIFRQETIVNGRESWSALNKAAAISIERCTRVCKFKTFKSSEATFKCVHVSPAHFDHRALLLPHLPCVNREIPFHNRASVNHTPRASTKSLSPALHAQSDGDMAMSKCEGELVAALAGCDDVPLCNALLSSCRALHESFSIHRLPDVVRWNQAEALTSINSSCSARHAASHTINFCIVCAMNGKGFQNKLRMCSVTRRLSCVSCPPGTKKVLHGNVCVCVFVWCLYGVCLVCIYFVFGLTNYLDHRLCRHCGQGQHARRDDAPERMHVLHVPVLHGDTDMGCRR